MSKEPHTTYIDKIQPEKKYEHWCRSLRRERSNLKNLDKNYNLEILYTPAAGMFYLSMPKCPDLLIHYCPFCGKELRHEQG